MAGGFKKWAGLDLHQNVDNPNHTPDLTVLNSFSDTATTLLPQGTDPLNPKSIILISLTNDRNSTVQLNSFVGSDYPTTIRTGGYVLTNGAAHVSNNVVYFKQN